MAPYYRALLSTSQPLTSPMSPSSPTYSRSFQIPLPEDNALLDRMERENEEELKKLDERLQEAEKTEGESEIADALKARATYLTRIGDKVSNNITIMQSYKETSVTISTLYLAIPSSLPVYMECDFLC